MFVVYFIIIKIYTLVKLVVLMLVNWLQVSRECDESLACILVNSTDLLRLDLDGVQMLVPSIIEALEIVLPDKDLKLR